MNVRILMKNRSWEWWTQWLVIALIGMGVVLQSYQKIHRPRLTTDFISWALSSMAPNWEMGMPYVDYWGINPPGVLLMTWIWGTLVGSSLLSFHILYLLCLGTISFLSWRILLKVFGLWESLCLFVVFGICFFSNTLQSQFFASEINGLVFSLLGLFIILKKSLSVRDILLAHICFVLAGQMKEVFAFSIVSTLPHILVSYHVGWRAFFRYCLWSLAGMLLGGLIILVYLIATGSVGAYREITHYKSTQFSITDFESISAKVYPLIQAPKEVLLAFDYQLPLLLAGGLMLWLFWMSQRSENYVKKGKSLGIMIHLPGNSLMYGVIVCFWLGSVLGYVVQGRSGAKYDLQPLLPMIIVIGWVGKLIGAHIGSLLQIPRVKGWVSIVAMGILLVPSRVLIAEDLKLARDYSLRSHLAWMKDAESPKHIGMELKMKEGTQPGDCVVGVYGWGIGSVYYYSQRPSCSKYFLINILPAERAQEYGEEILANPPAAVVYITEATDLNVEQFEKNVFNYTKVLEACYQQDDEFEQLYWLKVAKHEFDACGRVGMPNLHNEVSI